MDNKPVMGYFINSSNLGNSFNLGCSLRSYYFNDSHKTALVLAQKRLLDIPPVIKQVRPQVLRMLTACLYSDNVFTPN